MQRKAVAEVQVKTPTHLKTSLVQSNHAAVTPKSESLLKLFINLSLTLFYILRKDKG